MHDLVLWAAVLGMVGIAMLFVLEVRRWRQMGAIMGRSQRVLRAVTFTAIEVLFVMMLLGPSVTARRNPLVALSYWSLCLTLALLVIVFTLLIMLAAIRQCSELNRRAFRQFGSGGDEPGQPRRMRSKDDEP